MITNTFALITLSGMLLSVNAHVGGYHKAMFCRNGYSNEDQPNNNEVSNPLFQLSFDDFWFHGQCKNYPPPDGEYLELPAGGKTVLELSGNRGQTTLSFDGQYIATFPDGRDHPELDDGSWPNDCIVTPNLHTENATRAAGTVLAIAYKSDINDVKQEDLVVISVLPNSPWHRVAEYEIPADLPGCDDCICAYSWIPNHCGIPNMYMNGFKCKVTGARPDAPKLAKAQPAKWCEGKPEECVKGAKQITIYNQDPSANTVDLSGIRQADGLDASPGYNQKMGFSAGAQNDIFEESASDPVPPSSAPAPTSAPPSTPTSSPVPSETCSSGNGTRKRHYKHQRRLASFAGFHLSMDE